MKAREAISQPIVFTHERRKWVARQFPGVVPERFWKLAPQDQKAPMPGWREYQRAVTYFERSCA